jgi:hypothetical protein
MDSNLQSPLVESFRRGEVSRDVRLTAARGALPAPADEVLALLVMLCGDPDSEISAVATATLDTLPVDALRGFLAGPDVAEDIRAFFAARGVTADAVVPEGAEEAAADPAAASSGEAPEDAGKEEGEEGEKDDEEEDEKDDRVLSSLSIVERMKLAMKGTKAHRAQLIRDSNKLVAAAVLGSPKLTVSEVEAFAKMGNVSEEVLRTIAMNRSWVKIYGVIAGLARNPKTPPGISMHLVQRLHEKDLKMLTIDRNVPEAVRQAARKFLRKGPKDMG